MADEITQETVVEEAAVEVPEESAPKAKKKKKERVLPEGLSAYDHKRLDKDIKFRGPISYRYLRLIGWIAMALTFVSSMMGLAVTMKSVIGGAIPANFESLERVAGILSLFSALPLPLFLIANFAIILQSKNDYKKLIMGYLKLVLIIYVGFMFIYYHYVVIILMRTQEISFLEARNLSIEIFTVLGKQNGMVVNVFVDLFCCVLILFFIDYVPKKHFQGKKLILFRLLALLPLLYEVGSAVMMGLLGMNAINPDFTFSLPPELLPLIGKKPIGMIFAFVIICIYLKIRDTLYRKRGGTREGYELYLRTNRNSFKFSAVMSTTFLVVAIIDLIVAIALILGLVGPNPTEEIIDKYFTLIEGFTIGKSVCLILVIPFALLFDYTKQHKNPKLDKLMPLIGVGLVLFSAIETLFFTLLF